MGIRPNRDGLIPPVTPDNPETRYSDWLTDLEDSGEIVGGVWKETDAKATAAKDAADDLAGLIDTHKHVSSDISDTVIYSDSTMGIAGRIPRTGESGFLHQRDVPTHNSQLANKLYVDQQVADHQHVSADISDATFNIGGEGSAGKVLRTGVTGQLAIRTDSIVEAQHVANKLYVDQTVNPLEQRITAAETITTASGEGWRADKRNGLVTVTLDAATTGFTLPEGYRPPGIIYGSISYSRDSIDARFNITSYGIVSILGTVPNPAFGTVTFVAAT